MPETASLFEHELIFDPAADFDAFVRSAPAKWAVYLLSDADDRPIQLLCVKNLRYSLKHRLNGEETIGPSKRVNYREVVRRVRWARVDSAFEADWVYYETARTVFPQTYRGMVGFRPAWFLHVNPEWNFPRYVKTIDLTKAGELLGPVEDKHVAGKLIERVEDAFDLCRYYNVLVEAPNANACAYKEMGKCPAPCDGSVSMDRYRAMIAASVNGLLNPADCIIDQTKRMQAVAAELKFETAGKIKAFITQLSQFGKGSYRHLRRLSDFRFLSLQHGPRAGTAKAFLITPGYIEVSAGLLGEPHSPADLLRIAMERSAASTAPMDPAGAERVGIVSHHLFSAKSAHGAIVPLATLDEAGVTKAWRALQKQKIQEPTEGEGVMKELQSL